MNWGLAQPGLPRSLVTRSNLLAMEAFVAAWRRREGMMFVMVRLGAFG